MWTCPRCDRSFRNIRQRHSCRAIELEEHFAKKPPVIREIFDALIRAIADIGEIQVNVVKGAIFLKTDTTFVEIKTKKDCLLLAFYLAQEEQGPAIARTVEVSKNRVAHVLRLTHPDDLSEQVVSWLRQSYELITALKPDTSLQPG
jgi:hypothetical protein